MKLSVYGSFYFHDRHHCVLVFLMSSDIIHDKGANSREHLLYVSLHVTKRNNRSQTSFSPTNEQHVMGASERFCNTVMDDQLIFFAPFCSLSYQLSRLLRGGFPNISTKNACNTLFAPQNDRKKDRERFLSCDTIQQFFLYTLSMKSISSIRGSPSCGPA